MTAVVAVIALIVALLLAGACAVLLWQLNGLKVRAAALTEQVEALEPAVPLPVDLEALLGAGSRRVLVVEILNPLDVALTRNKAAGVLAAMAPDSVRKVVLEQASRELVTEMAAEGVEVEVRVHAAR
ncbi:hypothetical protein GCM10011584_08610 [Nocardioides phosphati]|uniref:Uncharacterized protein n=1 Tax=Nocardioides phosphati TaxID=1867775 RepID=A0ABQ2N6J5_9ACTN|nr:hypothetical protein [Nocardioides phosphati]GGO86399.1 hypothetical protein GCM10011584_08610 [Nocardioides phosphati]